MKQNWKQVKLGEVLEIKYGKDHKSIGDGLIPVYGSGGVMRHVNQAIYESESILIPRKGTLSNLFYVTEPFWSVDTMFYTKIKEGTSGRFLFYLLKTMDLASLNVGSAVPSLTTEVLNKIELEIPPLPTQTRIAAILSSLDNKIELNLRMNQTLEAMAQAIFKEWFVEFKFPGHKPGASKEKLPEGWRKTAIGELVNVQNGFAFKSNNFLEQGEDGVIKIKNIANNIVDTTNVQCIPSAVANKTDDRFRVLIGDLLIAMTGAEVGKIGIVPYSEKKLWLNQRVGKFQEKVQYAKWFCYLILSTNEYQSLLLSTASGSAQPNISATQIESIEAVIPDEKAVKIFGTLVNPIFEKMIFNLKENRTLTRLRDGLLPRLMSGKIEVN